jgi:hypothetical protein
MSSRSRSYPLVPAVAVAAMMLMSLAAAWLAR